MGLVTVDMIFVDTDILIDVMRGVSRVGQLLDRIASSETLAMCIVTQMELIVGCRNKIELAGLADFFDAFETIALNEASLRRAVVLLEEFRLSHGLLMADALIAATVLTSESSLLTRNTRHFSFRPGIQLVPDKLEQ